MHTSLLTARQVAQRLGIHRATAYRYMRDGIVPAIRLGRTVRVPEAALDALTSPSPNLHAGPASTTCAQDNDTQRDPAAHGGAAASGQETEP